MSIDIHALSSKLYENVLNVLEIKIFDLFKELFLNL